MESVIYGTKWVNRECLGDPWISINLVNISPTEQGDGNISLNDLSSLLITTQSVDLYFKAFNTVLTMAGRIAKLSAVSYANPVPSKLSSMCFVDPCEPPCLARNSLLTIISDSGAVKKCLVDVLVCWGFMLGSVESFSPNGIAWYIRLTLDGILNTSDLILASPPAPKPIAMASG